MPAIVLQDFEIMIEIASFDFFAPFEFIPVDFTETDALFEELDWVGYESQNFLENMGSIWLFAAI